MNACIMGSVEFSCSFDELLNKNCDINLTVHTKNDITDNTPITISMVNVDRTHHHFVVANISEEYENANFMCMCDAYIAGSKGIPDVATLNLFSKTTLKVTQ